MTDRAADKLRERIDSALAAASETHPSWKHRCTTIMAALGYDFGDPDWIMPGELRRLDAALARVAELEGLLGVKVLGQDEVARLLGLECDLDHVEVVFDVMFGEEFPWCVRDVDSGFRHSSHATRWDAIAAAAAKEAEYD